MTHVFVTGGAGFVGSHLCERLVAHGTRVTVLDDLSRGRAEWLPPECELIRADVRDRDGVAAGMQTARPDIVVHLAALHFIPAVDGAPELAHAVNVEGTRNVLDVARTVQLRRLVFASTAAVYPALDGKLNEHVPVAPIDLYGRTKAEGERMLSAYCRETGTACVAARLFNIVGPRETNPHVVPEVIGQIRAGCESLSLGTLQTRRDYVDARDVASALDILTSAETDGCTVFNVGTGIGVSVAELVDACRLITGRALPVTQDPARIRAVDRPSLVSDPSALVAATGWSPTWSLHDTLTELLLEAA